MPRGDLVYEPEGDAGYTEWVKAHPNGFVINVPSGNADMMWHQVGCGYIMPAAGWHAVGPNGRKVCSTHPGALARWSKSRVQMLTYCTDCQNQWAQTH
jgi:hypothetical protein